MAVLILKVTEACNARCRYCDVVHKPRPAVLHMDERTLEQVFVRVGELLRERPHETLELIWHGGEPLLRSPGFFTLALELQTRHCAGLTQRLRHGLQTNAIAFQPGHGAALGRLGLDSVGTSYDPLPGLRCLGHDPDSARYQRAFLDGVTRIEAAGLNWGLIYVVTRPALSQARSLFFQLTNLRPNGSILFNPVLSYGDRCPDLAVSPMEYVEFLAELFSLWWPRRHRCPGVQPFRSLVRNLREGPRELHCGNAGQCGAHYFNVAPNGAVSLCGRSSDFGLFPFGSLFDRSLLEILDDPQRAELRGRDALLAAGECAGCRHFPLCHGGCPLDAWEATGSIAHRTPWCAAQRQLVEAIVEPLLGGVA